MRKLWVFCALFLVGCGGFKRPQPTLAVESNRQMAGNVQIARDTTATMAGHVERAGQKVAAAIEVAAPIPSAAPVIQPLQEANQELEAAKVDITTLKATIAALGEQVKAQEKQIADMVSAQRTIAGQLDTVKGQLTAETTARKAAEEKYSEAWIGGRAWRWIWGIGVSVFVALLVGLILNFKTDIFLKPIEAVIGGISWLLSPAKVL